MDPGKRLMFRMLQHLLNAPYLEASDLPAKTPAPAT
jgi:hypothetical protein